MPKRRLRLPRRLAVFFALDDLVEPLSYLERTTLTESLPEWRRTRLMKLFFCIVAGVVSRIPVGIIKVGGLREIAPQFSDKKIDR